MTRTLSLLVAALFTAASGTALAAPIISPFAADLAASAYSHDTAASG